MAPSFRGRKQLLQDDARHGFCHLSELYPVLQSALANLESILLAVPALSKALAKTGDPYQHFIPLLGHRTVTDDPIPLLTSTVLVSLMAGSRDESQAASKALPLIYSYLSSLTTNSDAGLQDIGVQEYSSLLYGRVPRAQFWEQRSETVAPLVKILRAAAGIGSGGDATASLWSGTTNPSRSGFEGSLGGGVGLQLLYHVLLVVWQLSFEAADIGDDLNK